MRQPPKFTQADVARAIKGASKGGMNVECVEITPDGKIVLISAETTGDDARNPLDVWRSRHGQD